MSDKIKNPEALLGAIKATDELARLTEQKVATLKQMRRVLAREAIKHGLLDPVVKQGEPCPVCTAKRRFAFYSDQCDQCGHKFYPMKRTVEPLGLEKFLKSGNRSQQ